jgi:hypothetical protein
MKGCKRTMLGLAIVFGGFSAAKFFVAHDLETGLWSFAVCLALVLGILPAWLTGSAVESEGREFESLRPRHPHNDSGSSRGLRFVDRNRSSTAGSQLNK